MPQYRCKFNGVIIEVKDGDTEEMDKHEGYERFVEAKPNMDSLHIVQEVAPKELKKPKKKKKAKRKTK